MRIGNAASEQFQLDVYGELMDAMLHAREHGLHPDEHAWRLQTAMLDFLEGAWDQPDEGIWEVRGPRRHFVHSKVMAWVAFDRAATDDRAVRHAGRCDPLAARLREAIHEEVLEHGWDADRNTFTQSYGSQTLDAALLLIGRVGFLPGDDPRVVGTVDAIQRELVQRRLRAALPDRRGRRRPAARRGRVPAVQLLARRRARRVRPPRRGAQRCTTAWPGWPTTSGCSPRSTTRSSAGWSATSRRRSRTWRR